ncbi:MAG TPA: hypothetical protein VF263_20495 [Longimicrobiaceae bacterium]
MTIDSTHGVAELSAAEARSTSGGTILPGSTLVLLADLAISYETMKAQQTLIRAATAA